jgi:Na+-transporting NADH:ubiquinone oxidoreductase subunit F
MSDILAGATLFTLIVMTLVAIVLAARALILKRAPVMVTVNGANHFTAQTGQKLLEVLRDNGILVPSVCAGAGTCGLCRVEVPVGGGQILPTERAKLDRTEMRNLVRLACQVTVRRDTLVRVSADLLGTETWKCRVVSARMMTPFIREIVVELPKDATPLLRAGSFVQVTAPAHDIRFADFDIPEKFEYVWTGSTLRELISQSKTEVSRAYSTANRPCDQGKIVLNVRLALPPPTPEDVPPGVVSSYLFSLRAGENLKVAGSYGSFCAKDTEREMIFIGGGVGMPPLRSIIFDQLESTGTSRRMSFWYGGRSKTDLFYEEEFDSLQDRFDNFSWTIALSDPKPEDNWEGPVGFIHDVVYQNYLRDHNSPEDCEYYLCGPPLMIRAVMSLLEDIGVDPDNIFNDDFGN